MMHIQRRVNWDKGNFLPGISTIILILAFLNSMTCKDDK
jgi:hypothetical protein